MKAPIQALFAGLILAGHAHADTPAAASTLGWNAAATSDYRYRGISQTRLRPALQGGVDYVHASGWYAGAWASTIKWIGDAGGKGEVEIDLYGGKRGELPGALSYDVGVLRYFYPDNGMGRVSGFANAHTTEAYLQLGVGPAWIKYSHALTNLFGFVDSGNSGYLDLGANIDAGKGFMLNLHAGRQRVDNNSAASYTDWKVGVTRQFELASVALAVVGTNAGKTAYASPANGKFLGRKALQLSVSRTF
ncbi:TorF family putative porin [Massilia niastensis]|uniref:TorF family putative porin n=1 Tax=Massilia niastensis TaxID=544911 RepID=UPI000382E9CB|nr:TorF family putative porin [Massilia niastensis]